MKITEESMKQQASGQDASAGSQPEIHEAPRQTEREKLRAMAPKDRLWYVWAYYKFHILAVIVAAAVIYSACMAFYNTTFDTALYCFYLNSRGAEVNTGPLEEGYAQFMELGKKELVTAETGYVSFDDSATEYSYAVMAKITALVMAHDLDVMIGDTESTDHYASIGGFVDLEETLPSDVLALIQDRLYYAEDDAGASRACAIDLSGTDFAKESLLAQDKPLLALVAGSERTDHSVNLIRYIFGASAVK
ncbi:MAG: hypothetical protein Q4C73_09740 [Eubacteriales bacterium]|nr:hypothetical protein [Eubacteriales bacterium]